MTRRLALVEDDEPVRTSLAALLESWDFRVQAFEDGESYLAALPDADCILLDVRLPGIDGLSLLKQMRERGTRTPVIVLTGHGDVAMAVQALREGANDFLEKPYDDEELVERIETALRDAAVRASEEDAGSDAQEYARYFAALTPRETDVMNDVVAGHPNKIIAHRRGLSPKTVEIHRARVMEKTGAKSLSHLVRMALKAGIDPDNG